MEFRHCACSPYCLRCCMMHFERMPPLSLLKGSKLKDVEARDFDWAFVFDCGVGVVAESHWRLLDEERVIVTDEDHGHLFSLTEPVDAASVLRTELHGANVVRIAFRLPSSDLLLLFSNGCTLEVLVNSGGYENWHVHGSDGSQTFASGGGSLNHATN